LVICANSVFADSTEEIEHTYRPLLGEDRVVRYDAGVPQSQWSAKVVDVQRLVAEWIAKYAWTAQKPDLIHISSVFEGLYGQGVVSDRIGLPRATVLSATAYDLIPLIYADTYLQERDTRDWYMSRIERLRRCDVLLAISQATRQDVIERLDFPPDRIVAIQGAADARFYPAVVAGERRNTLLGGLGIAKPYVMYTGGIDHRKNVDEIIRAFGLLPPALRNAHQLVIVCSLNEIDRARLQTLIKRTGLARDCVVLTGFVSDDDLVDLYRCCDLFVFPSKYEGFGLPVLEAMACGVPTLAANASSLPEIVGRSDALFSIDRDDSIAEAIAHALTDHDFRGELREYATERAKSFSWQLVADRAADAWLDALDRKRERITVDVTASKRRLAVVSPLYPERSGIADFVTELLPHLTRHFDIDLFASEEADADRYRAMGFGVYPWHALPGRWLDYDAGVLYQFGNSSFHVHMLALLSVCPGAVFLHDAYLSGLMAFVEFGTPGLDRFFEKMLAYCHPGDPVAQYAANGLDDAIERYPMCRWVADHATGVVVTSQHARRLLRESGQIDGARCRVIQLQRAARPISASEKAHARSLLGIPHETFLVCSLGFADDRKLSIELVNTWSQIRFEDDARLFFVGDAEGVYGEALRRRVAASPKSSKIGITGYVSDADFERYIEAADLIVQLRKGSRGEASLAALNAMAHGIPLVASRHGSLAEIPSGACLHVDDPFNTDQLARIIEEIAGSPELRAMIGQAGQSWIREACEPANIARAVAVDIASFNDPSIVRRRSDLIGRAMAFSEVGSVGAPGRWVNDVAARAESCEPDRLRGVEARAIAQAIRALVPMKAVAPAARDDGLWMPARDGTLTIPASDSRFLTECGVKSGLVVETAQRGGMLLYGPFIHVSPGRYRIRIYGTNRTQASSGCATLDIVCNSGRRTLASSNISLASDAPRIADLLARLDFAAQEAVEDLEIRIHVTREVNMVVEGIDLVALHD